MQKPAPVYSHEFVLRPETDLGYQHFQDAANQPFQASAAGIPRVNVWWLADAALLSYWELPDAARVFGSVGFSCELVRARSTDCYVAWSADAVLVVFRGTEPDQWPDVLTDVKLLLVPWDNGRGHVHKGFKDAIDAIWMDLSVLIESLRPSRSVWFCGHSLGAALAALAADRFQHTRGVCTFGSPRVGDHAFAAAFNTRLAGRTLRYVNNHDVVTHVPPPLPLPVSYKHVDVRRSITQDGVVTLAPPHLEHFFTDLIGQPSQLLDTIEAVGDERLRSAPQFLLDHMPKAYAIWAWNDYDRNG